MQKNSIVPIKTACVPRWSEHTSHGGVIVLFVPHLNPPDPNALFLAVKLVKALICMCNVGDKNNDESRPGSVPCYTSTLYLTNQPTNQPTSPMIYDIAPGKV